MIFIGPQNRLMIFLTIVSSGIVFLLVGCQITNTQNQSSQNQIEALPTKSSLFDGRSIGISEIEHKALAVVMDNFFASRPPSGINSAAVVYEAPVESNISRFLVIFSPDNLPDKIGPIRSARPYLAELADEYRAVFIHIGGSPEALSNIKSNLYQINNFDAMGADGQYSWRDSGRKAPFNLYTNGQNISNFINNSSIDNVADFSSWNFKDELIQKTEPLIKEVKIINAGYFEPITWRYDETDSCYLKFLVNNDAEQAYVDDEGAQICAKNLILQYTNITTIDLIGRKKIDLDGDGPIKIYQAGQEIDGIWQKKNNRTRFYDSSGQEINLLKGNIWVEIMPLAIDLSSNP